MGPLVQDPKTERPEKMKDAITEDMNVDIIKAAASNTLFSPKQFGGSGPSNFSVGEGRVHGGSHFMKVGSVLGTGSSTGAVASDSSQLMKSLAMPHNWM